MSNKQHLWRQKVIAWLKDNVSDARLNHILGVETTCIQLAQYHQVSVEKAAKAGLLHDLAKFFAKKKLLKIARQEKLEIDLICQQHPHLLHADVSAVIANQEFGVADLTILEAISNHTLGRPKMSDLSCVVYVADAIEPNRGNTAQLNHLREVAAHNLKQAVWETSDYAINCLVSDRKVIHPRTILTRNWALKNVKSAAISR